MARACPSGAKNVRYVRLDRDDPEDPRGRHLFAVKPDHPPYKMALWIDAVPEMVKLLHRIAFENFDDLAPWDARHRKSAREEARKLITTRKIDVPTSLQP